MRNRPSRPVPAVAAIVINEQDEVLLVRRARDPGRGRWTIPGGRIKLGETMAAAARREVLEETGIEVEVESAVWLAELIDPDENYHFIILDFLAHPVGGELRPGDDAEDATFVGPSDLAAYDLIGSTDVAIKRAFAARDSDQSFDGEFD